KKREEEERREAKRREEEERKEAKRREEEIKDGMTLAPIQRRAVLQLEDDILEQRPEYLVQPFPENSLLNCGGSRWSGTTESRLENCNLKLAVPCEQNLFQFHDNYRPPYYGTWRTRSATITGRRPFTTKEENIDYEVDSDAEWEEEPSDAEECKSDEE
ncbi:hypothetical protein OSTOST_18950, partial [Ostertagia ostertagi]